MTDKQTVDVGQVENAKRIWVSTSGNHAAYWPNVPWVEGYGLESRAAFDERQAIEATAPEGRQCRSLAGFYNEDESGDFYLFWEADCFDPPQYLIRARSFEDAYETFIEEFATVLDDVTVAEYEDNDAFDTLHWISRGAVDTESINGCEVSLLRVDC